MKTYAASAFLSIAIGLLTACAAPTEEPAPTAAPTADKAADRAAEKTSETSEPLMAAEQICCNNISGYGSVVYYQSWGGYGWITGDTFYHEGGGCPGTSGNCTRIDPQR